MLQRKQQMQKNKVRVQKINPQMPHTSTHIQIHTGNL